MGEEQIRPSIVQQIDDIIAALKDASATALSLETTIRALERLRLAYLEREERISTWCAGCSRYWVHFDDIVHLLDNNDDDRGT